MKIVDTKTLLRLTDQARRQQLNRLLPPKVAKMLDQNGMHVLSQPMMHNDVECIRCLVVMLKIQNSENAYETMLDFDIDAYNKIPNHKEVEN